MHAGACRSRSVVWLCANRLKVAARSDNGRPPSERLGHFDAKGCDQTFAFGQEPPAVDEPGADSRLHGFDQRSILIADLIVERDQLARPLFVDIRPEEVVQEPDRRAGDSGQAGPVDRFSGPG